MKVDDLLVDTPTPGPWGETTKAVNLEMLATLRLGPLPDVDDLDIAIPLAQLTHDEHIAFGTGGTTLTDEADARALLLALRATLARLSIAFEVPWRDYDSFRTHWLAEGCSGSWQARRELLRKHFDPVHDELLRLEDRSMTTCLAVAVTPARGTGWPKVDAEVNELRRRFAAASTPQDYRAVGTHCVGVLEALSRTVYDPAIHLRAGETVPAVDKTKQRIGRFVEDSLTGSENADLRGVVTKASDLAHSVKHSETPTRRDAGICADAVIMLANLLRRLAE